jgi:hypothetical protein
MAIEVSQALVAADRSGTDANGAIGVLLANARSGANPTPYYGYHFRIVAPPGQDSVVGAKREVAAVVAYPAEYRSSGVMTFIVGPDNAVYEKDLGPKTAEIARALTADTPDASWKLVGQDP